MGLATYLACPLVIAEEEKFVMDNRPANRSAELIAVKLGARRSGNLRARDGIRIVVRKEVAGIHLVVAEKLKSVSVELVRARLGDDIDQAAAVVPVLCVEVRGLNSEFGNRIEVGDNRRPVAAAFLDVAPVYEESVRILPLPADRHVAGGLTSVLARRSRHDARLQRHEVRVAPPIKRHLGHVATGDDLAHFSPLRLDEGRGAGNRDLLQHGPDFEFHIQPDLGGHIHFQSRLAKLLKTFLVERQIICSDRQVRKGVNALGIGYHRSFDPCRRVTGRYGYIGDDGAGRIRDHARNASGVARPNSRNQN